jgi:hypothetical protein
MRIFDILPAVNGRGFFQSRPLELLVQRVHLLTTSTDNYNQRWFSPQSFSVFQHPVSVCPTVQFKPK